MPKQFSVKMEVPSGSRPSRMLDWLNKQLNPHGMKVLEVTDDESLADVTKDAPQETERPIRYAKRSIDDAD